jgi:hypothetical protein
MHPNKRNIHLRRNLARKENPSSVSHGDRSESGLTRDRSGFEALAARKPSDH